jgi:hypothetical protein
MVFYVSYQYAMFKCTFVMFLQRFAAVIMRIREPKTTALIFASGKMVSLAKASGISLFTTVDVLFIFLRNAIGVCLSCCCFLMQCWSTLSLKNLTKVIRCHLVGIFYGVKLWS